jgi:hypothetical protein
MKAIGLANKLMHADHFIPLALGGIHDERNLRPLSGPENINKKDKLTPAAFDLMMKDPSYLSRQHRRVFHIHKNKGREVIQEALRNSVHSQYQKIIAMSEEQKFVYIQKRYPSYKESQIRRIIRKHFTPHEDQSL